LLLSVEPGFQGQPFVPNVLDKISSKPDGVVLGVDGGMNNETIDQAFSLGADYAIVGSSIWNSPDPVAFLKSFNELV
jgi:ribulose-phosphate 3-epimerase